jgi:uncharacterized protein YcfL
VYQFRRTKGKESGAPVITDVDNLVQILINLVACSTAQKSLKNKQEQSCVLNKHTHTNKGQNIKATCIIHRKTI